MPDDSDSSVTLAINKAQFKELLNELHFIGRAIAASRIRPDGDLGVNARFLKVFGFSEYDIADMLGVNQSTVNRALKKKEKSHDE